MPYVHEHPDWPKLRWNDAKLSPLLAEVRHRQGRLLGRMEGLGFRLRAEATLTTLTSDVIKSRWLSFWTGLRAKTASIPC